MDIGNTMKKIRIRTGKSQNEFASFCGITQTYLSRIESNRQYPNLATFKKICDRLGIPLPILFLISMSEDDIPEKNRDTFTKVEPAVSQLVRELKKFYSIID